MTDPFTDHRALLFTVAYEILGSAADAEDAIQDAWLRWSADDRSSVADPKAYSVRIVTRVALNRLRTLSRRRENYVGPWLPEPILTTPDIADDVVLSDSVSLAMLVVLDTLKPVERAVFVLREVFGYEFSEIAEMVERQPAAVRQIAHRARSHVRARRSYARDSDAHSSQVRHATTLFATAAESGDPTDLLELISPDVVLVTDGGGVRKAALRPILGLDKVIRFLLAVRPDGKIEISTAELNGAPAVITRIDGRIDSALAVDVDDGLIRSIFIQRNPEKLTNLDSTRPLAR